MSAGVPPSGSGCQPSASAVPASRSGIPNAVADALLECVDAMRDYIVPDGISDDDFANRIIGALDNPDINPFIRELEHGRS